MTKRLLFARVAAAAVTLIAFPALSTSAQLPVSIQLTTSKAELSVGDTLTVTAVFQADVSTPLVAAGVGFRRGTHVYTPDEVASVDDLATKAEVMDARPRGKYWYGDLLPGRPVTVTARFAAAECGTDSIVAFCKERFPRMACDPSTPGAAAVDPFSTVYASVPVCVRGYRQSPTRSPQATDRQYRVLPAYPVGDLRGDTLAPLPTPQATERPQPFIFELPATPDPQPRDDDDPCCLDSPPQPPSRDHGAAGTPLYQGDCTPGPVWAVTGYCQVVSGYCMLFWWEYPPGVILDVAYSVYPPSLGTIVELPDHKGKFTAGSSNLTGEIRGTHPQYTLQPYPTRVVRDFDIQGTFEYQDYTGTFVEAKPAKFLATQLYYADPNGQYTFYVPNAVRFSLFEPTETDRNGEWVYALVDRDQVLFLLNAYDYYSPHVREVSRNVGSNYHAFGLYVSPIAYFVDDFLLIDFDDYPGLFVHDLPQRGAFNIADVLYDAWEFVRDGSGYATPLIRCRWDPALPNTTNYEYVPGQPGQEFINIRGANPPSWLLDEWNDAIITHEYGHHVMYRATGAVGLPQSPICNPHPWEAITDRQCAYKEGWADLLGAASNNDSRFHYYLRTVSGDTSDSVVDLETGLAPPNNPRGPSSEQAVATHLWDIFDFPNDDDGSSGYNSDYNAGTFYRDFEEIADVSFNYRPGGQRINEFGDFCEGWQAFGYPYLNEPGDVFLNIGMRKGTNCLWVVYGVADLAPGTPAFALHASPNPFFAMSNITCAVPLRQTVQLDVLAANGRHVRRLVDAVLDPGTYTLTWDGRDNRGHPVGSAVYFYRLKGLNRELTRKIVLVR